MERLKIFPQFVWQAHTQVDEQTEQISKKLLIVPYKDGLTSLDPEDICYISAADNYCKIVTTNGIVYTVRITLKNLEAILITMPVKDVVILRIHKSHIIALRDIRLNKQITRVQCKDGAVLEISSEGRGKLLQHLVIL